ncbi:hypothetical protein ACM916_002829 [Cronobacter turicensis]|nr:hypothetical protein [Cronobacter turicensis]
MDEINYYTDNINECLKGYITFGDATLFAELTINDKSISIRVFDFDNITSGNGTDFITVKSFIFQKSFNYYLLFGLELNGMSSIRTSDNNQFSDFLFSAQGFLHSRSRLSLNDLFRSISIYGDGIKKWSGNTRKLNNMLEHGISNILPNDEDCIEFEKYIPDIGNIGLYYSYRFGGLKGLYTAGIDIEPYIMLSFERAIKLDEVIEQYIDLYMLLRFLIGDSLSISNIKVRRKNDGNSIQLYLAEKKGGNTSINTGMLLPYSSIFRDDSENSFHHSLWLNYYNTTDNHLKELIKKYITYTMIHDTEEQFLGFYRIIETMTLRTSCYVDKDKLDNLLKRSRKILSKIFPGPSLRDFIRAIKRANKSQHNTESCIRHFIHSLPKSIIQLFRLDEIEINDICSSRNKIIHQPLFTETPERLYKHLIRTETLVKLALLTRLDIPTDKIENIRINHLW